MLERTMALALDSEVHRIHDCHRQIRMVSAISEKRRLRSLSSDSGARLHPGEFQRALSGWRSLRPSRCLSTRKRCQDRSLRACRGRSLRASGWDSKHRLDPFEGKSRKER